MKKITIVSFCMLFSIFSSAQSNIWEKAAGQDLKSEEKIKRKSSPKEYQIFRLDIDAFKAQLEGAPVRGSFSGRSNKLIFLPNSRGEIQRFHVMETPIMEKELAEKFPMIRSYAAQGADDPTATARFSMTQFGLHGMVFSSGNATDYIDPFTEDRQHYIVYSRTALSASGQDFQCLIAGDGRRPSLEGKNSFENGILAADDQKLRTYRLALSCTGEYGALFAGAGTVAQQKANVQAQMAITMTRVNGIYEKDLAITMIFVANNDLAIYLDAATDPWNGEYNTTTAQTIDADIGFGNYDIGHNFNIIDGGSAGCIGCVCSSDTDPAGNSHKGSGYTGQPNPTGDTFDVDYVAHEMGHQFGGFHTQSNLSCRDGNVTEVEPGSGSTIMGYAGICAPNVQNQSDDYFAYVNIQDILLNVKSGVSSSCAQITNIANNPPTADAGRDYIIPRSTPFMLAGTGSDADGDALTYTWEQNDPEPIESDNNAAPTATRVQGPMFRSIRGTASPTRFMPAIQTVLNGALSTTWEVLPSVGRIMNFSLTVRDNVAGGGQAATDLMRVTVDGVSGPFAVTAPDTNITFQAGTNQTVTWNVAGTDANAVNTPFVDIFLSTDGGASFPTLLASRVPNDGSEIITVPNVAGTQNRIMVKGYDNIFYDLSDTNFTITVPAPSFAIAFSGMAGEQNKEACIGSDFTYTISYTALAGFSGNTTFAVTGQPSGSTATVTPGSLNANGSLTVSVTNTGSSPMGFYNLTVAATSGAVTKTVNLYLNFLGTVESLISPANAATITPSEGNLTWSSTTGATQYLVEISTDNAFSNIVDSATVSSNSYSATGLANFTTYYWRVMPLDSPCTGVYSATSNFSTTFCGSFASADVPITIPSSGTPTVNSTLNIASAESVMIQDLSVSLDISHTFVNNLTATLIAPDGTQIQLFADQCSLEGLVATFNDSGIPLACGDNPGISETVMPVQPLSVLNGQPSQGLWTLRTADDEDEDGGTLNSWSLNICSVQPPLKTAENTFEDFAAYPNPNSGSFNIQFTNSSSNNIKIEVFDMRGRRILENSYGNQVQFNENVRLNVQAGVYLLHVSGGGRRIVKRIAIR